MDGRAQDWCWGGALLRTWRLLAADCGQCACERCGRGRWPGRAPLSAAACAAALVEWAVGRGPPGRLGAGAASKWASGALLCNGAAHTGNVERSMARLSELCTPAPQPARWKLKSAACGSAGMQGSSQAVGLEVFVVLSCRMGGQARWNGRLWQLREPRRRTGAEAVLAHRMGQ